MLYDQSCEQFILGSALYDPETIVEFADILKPVHFYSKKHQTIFKAIMDEWDKASEGYDTARVMERLERRGIERDYLSELALSIASTAPVRDKAERLRSLTAGRYAVKVGQKLTELNDYRDTEDIKKVIQDSEAKLSKVADFTTETETLTDIQDLLMDYNDELEEIMATGGGITGIPSGIIDLDKMTAGFQKSDLIIIAGRPSMGKTAFMLELAMHTSANVNTSTLVFSLEMAKKQLAKRMIASEARINLHNLNTGQVSHTVYQHYVDAVDKLSRANLVIDDQGAMTVQQLKAKARKVNRERGLGCIFIDYLGLIEGERGQSDYERVTTNVKALKAMAKEFEVPIICLSQLNRGVEQRRDKRPTLSDLRESGEVEQTADIVGFLYRDEYYNPNTDKQNIAELIIAKQRNGPTGTVEMVFMKEYNKFLPLDKRYGDGGQNENETA